MSLTDVAIRKLAVSDRPFKAFDAGGLFLLVTPTSRLWRLRYRFGGREKLLSLGPYPTVTLAAARTARDEARAHLRAGRDPSLVRRLGADPDQSFEAIARAWHAAQSPSWTARHAADVIGSLERLAFPRIGRLPAAEVTAPMVLDLLRAIERRPAIETARRVRQRIDAVFAWAIAEGKCERNPGRDVAQAMSPLPARTRQPAVLTIEAARKLLADCEAIPSHPTTRLAMRFLALTAARPGEVRGARFDEIAGEVWTIPAARMKARRPHLVPLTPAAREVIEAAREIAPGALIFPSTRWARRPMSDCALLAMLIRAGYGGIHVPHGWRATFSTVMNERFPADRAVIDLMLAHAPKDQTESAYNRAEHMERRVELAAAWASLLCGGMEAAQVLLDRPKR